MRFSVLTLFPKMFDGFMSESIISHAIDKRLATIEIINFREYSKEKTHRVDDYQIGGGGGMVIGIEPIVACIKDIKTPTSKVILLSPQGHVFNQTKAKELVSTNSQYDHLILVCGHYEGFDERIINYVDDIISVGDYVLTGGEIPAMIVMDACIRLIDNVIKPTSLISESFNNYLLDYPVYTKPYEFEGHKVPEILLSGNHQKIDEYRKQQQIKKTKKYRKDLYQKYLEALKNKKE